jgi:hypothetical protein
MPLQDIGKVAGRNVRLIFDRAADSVIEALKFWFGRGLSPNPQTPSQLRSIA